MPKLKEFPLPQLFVVGVILLKKGVLIHPLSSFMLYNMQKNVPYNKEKCYFYTQKKIIISFTLNTKP